MLKERNLPATLCFFYHFFYQAMVIQLIQNKYKKMHFLGEMSFCVFSTVHLKQFLGCCSCLIQIKCIYPTWYELEMEALFHCSERAI